MPSGPSSILTFWEGELMSGVKIWKEFQMSWSVLMCLLLSPVCRCSSLTPRLTSCWCAAQCGKAPAPSTPSPTSQPTPRRSSRPWRPTQRPPPPTASLGRSNTTPGTQMTSSTWGPPSPSTATTDTTSQLSAAGTWTTSSSPNSASPANPCWGSMSSTGITFWSIMYTGEWKSQ